MFEAFFECAFAAAAFGGVELAPLHAVGEVVLAGEALLGVVVVGVMKLFVVTNTLIALTWMNPTLPSSIA